MYRHGPQPGEGKALANGSPVSWAQVCAWCTNLRAEIRVICTVPRGEAAFYAPFWPQAGGGAFRRERGSRGYLLPAEDAAQKRGAQNAWW